MNIGAKQKKLSLFAHEMIAYLEELTEKLLSLKSEFIKVARYKINISDFKQGPSNAFELMPLPCAQINKLISGVALKLS